METINDIIALTEQPPTSFEEYLSCYASKIGDILNAYIPSGSHPDMDRYLYDPLKRYSENGGKRHHLLRGMPRGRREHGARHERCGGH